MKALRTSFPLLPEELIHEILLRLPVKSLLRFRSVCHGWNSIITDPSFRNSNGFLLYWTQAAAVFEDDDDDDEYDAATDHIFIDYHAFSLFPDERLAKHRVTDYGWFPNSVRKIYGPCRGVVCVLQAGDRMCLCNPATKGFRQLPVFHARFHGVVDFGFGVDPVTDGFKVVLIRESGHFAVWKSGTNCWTAFEQEDIVSDPDTNYSRGVYTNGFCYWVKYNTAGSSAILVFDMSRDSFQEVKMPPQIVLSHGVELDLYNDSLAVLTYKCRSVDVWLMEEKECWRKVDSIVLPSEFEQVGVWKRNRIFASVGKNKMMIYDPDSCSTRQIEFRRTEDDCFTYYSPPLPYKETFVPV